MRQCNYVILDYCKSDLTSDCVPCLLLLDINRDESSRDFKVFVLPDMERLLGKMSSQGREWMLEVLSDLRERPKSSEAVDEITFEQFHALSVGPLRTSIHGVIDIIDKDDVLDLIWAQNKAQGQPAEDEDRSLRSFQELTFDMMQQYRQRFNLIDPDKRLAKSAAISASALALFSLIS